MRQRSTTPVRPTEVPAFASGAPHIQPSERGTWGYACVGLAHAIGIGLCQLSLVSVCRAGTWAALTGEPLHHPWPATLQVCHPYSAPAQEAEPAQPEPAPAAFRRHDAPGVRLSWRSSSTDPADRSLPGDIAQVSAVVVAFLDHWRASLGRLDVRFAPSRPIAVTVIRAVGEVPDEGRSGEQDEWAGPTPGDVRYLPAWWSPRQECVYVRTNWAKPGGPRGWDSIWPESSVQSLSTWSRALGGALVSAVIRSLHTRDASGLTGEPSPWWLSAGLYAVAGSASVQPGAELAHRIRFGNWRAENWIAVARELHTGEYVPRLARRDPEIAEAVKAGHEFPRLSIRASVLLLAADPFEAEAALLRPIPEGSRALLAGRLLAHLRAVAALLVAFLSESGEADVRRGFISTVQAYLLGESAEPRRFGAESGGRTAALPGVDRERLDSAFADFMFAGANRERGEEF